MLWEHLTSTEFRKAVEQSKGVCLVPIGCLEKHGAHSPLGTDTIIAAETARRAAEAEPVVVFPTMYFGDKTGSGEFPGTVIFSLETRWHIFRETCFEIYRNGFKKVLFYNCHGGNYDMIGAFTRAMLKELPELLLFRFDTGNANASPAKMVASILSEREKYSYLTEEDCAALQDFVDSKKRTGHACFLETAKVYHYLPDKIKLDAIRAESGENIHRFDEFQKRLITSPFTWMANYPSSSHGSNDYVLNERIAKAVSDWNTGLLTEMVRFLKNETISDEYHAEWLAKQ